MVSLSFKYAAYNVQTLTIGVCYLFYATNATKSDFINFESAPVQYTIT